MSYYMLSHSHQFNPSKMLLVRGNFFFLFTVTISPFCGETGTLCFGLQLTLFMSSKSRVDAPSPVLNITFTQ